MLDSRVVDIPRGFQIVSRAAVDTRLPERKTRNSAGYDFYAPETYVVPAHGNVTIKTGIKAYMLSNEVLLLYIRSSLGIKHGLRLANCTGVIDSDYYNNPENEGEIMAKVINDSDNDFIIGKHDSFMQGIFQQFLTGGDMPIHERKGGVGSTGR